MSDAIFTNGYNLGTIGTGNTVYITYRVRADAEEKFDETTTELKNKATMVYDSDEASGETRTATTTITVKKEEQEPEVPPAEELNNCETNPGLPECQNCTTNPELPECQNCETNPNLPECQKLPQELPNTGPVEFTVALVIVLGLCGAGFYLYRSQRTLRKTESAVMGSRSAGRGGSGAKAAKNKRAAKKRSGNRRK